MCVSGSTPPNTYIVFPVDSPKPSVLKYGVDGIIPLPGDSPTAVKLIKVGGGVIEVVDIVLFDKCECDPVKEVVGGANWAEVV